MKINVTCWTSKWNTWSWWKNRVPQCHFGNPSASQHSSVLGYMSLLPQNIFRSTLSASKRSNKEHVGVFWQQQPITGSTSLYFSHLRTCSSPGFGDFHHNTFLFEPPDSSLLSISYLKPPFHSARGVCAGCFLLAQLANTSMRGWVYMLNRRSSAAKLVFCRLFPRASGDQVSSNILLSHLKQNSNLTVWSSFTHWPREIIFLANA